MKLLALDGNSIINRAFYGIKLLTTKDGRYTNGIYGFINIINKLIELETPDCIAVAFDMRAPTFRHKKYAEYKAGRKGMPPELAEQMPILKEWIKLMGYHSLEMEGYEADDILGTLSKVAKNSGDECVIATGDRDTLQLVNSQVKVLLATTKMGKPEIINYNENEIKERYGVSPSGMLEIKALMGDSSDNIPGVAGVGEKTAMDLISRFETIDYIYENLDTIDIKPAVRTKLEKGKESAYLSRQLGCIYCDVPVSMNLADYLPGERHDTELVRLMTNLEFFKLMERMELKPNAHAVLTDEDEEKIYNTVKTVEEIITSAKLTGFADLLFLENEIIVAADSNVFEIKLNEECGPSAAKLILIDPEIKKRVNDAKAVYKWALQNDIEPELIVFDTSIAGYLLSPSAKSYQTDRLALEYGVRPPKFNDDVSEMAEEGALHSEVCERMQNEIDANEQNFLLNDIELPLTRVLAEMELAGFLVDVGEITDYGNMLGKKISKIESEIFELVGYSFNLNSPKQLGVALFEKLGLPAKKKTKTGYSTGAEVLEELRDAHPAVSLLLEYRQLAKLKSTYCDGLPKTADENGRIHSTLNQTETRTGRISSTDPNLQNIPIRTEEGRQLRKYFKASDGYVLCDADYSQIELRVLAHMAGDKAMVKAFTEGADIHTITASQVFGMPPEMVTPLMRGRAKAVNFGIVYGIGAFSLSKDIGVTRAEASSYIKGYFETFPQVAEYMEKVVNDAKENGYVVTLFGRRRYLPELSSSNANIRAFGERVARNMPIQGTAADIIKIAMIRVRNRLKQEYPQARLILQVHDELIVEAPENTGEAVSAILKEEMQNACKMSIPLTVDVSSGKTWYDAKG